MNNTYKDIDVYSFNENCYKQIEFIDNFQTALNFLI